jgi:hypothetical protein
MVLNELKTITVLGLNGMDDPLSQPLHAPPPASSSATSNFPTSSLWGFFRIL